MFTVGLIRWLQRVSTRWRYGKVTALFAWRIFKDFANRLAFILCIISWRELCIVKMGGFPIGLSIEAKILRGARDNSPSTGNGACSQLQWELG